jgi:hypothetical protein
VLVRHLVGRSREVRGGDPEATARVVTILNRYPDRFLFGTDTVAPSGPEPYYAVFDMWAPVWKQLTPEASLKSSQEAITSGSSTPPSRVRAWERANVH